MDLERCAIEASLVGVGLLLMGAAVRRALEYGSTVHRAQALWGIRPAPSAAGMVIA